MAKYQEEVKVLLDAIGGKANIQAVSHCMTRMRFVLVDPKKADEQAIEAISCVKGTFTQAGQFQVIIGNDVANFYKEFTQYAGIEGVSKDAVKSAAKTNQNPVQRIMGALGEIFAPIIPALICGGLVLGFRNIIGEVDLLNGRTQSLADVSQFWAGMYSFLWLIGEAIFHFLPVGITWSITKKMGTTQILGIVLGLTLISPQLLNGFSVATTAPEDIPVWDFGFAQVPDDRLSGTGHRRHHGRLCPGLSGKVFDRIGIKKLFVTGALFMLLSNVGMYFITLHTPLFVACLLNVVRCVAIGCLMMPLITWGTAQVDGAFPRGRLGAADLAAHHRRRHRLGCLCGPDELSVRPLGRGLWRRRPDARHEPNLPVHGARQPGAAVCRGLPRPYRPGTGAPPGLNPASLL